MMCLLSTAPPPLMHSAFLISRFAPPTSSIPDVPSSGHIIVSRSLLSTVIAPGPDRSQSSPFPSVLFVISFHILPTVLIPLGRIPAPHARRTRTPDALTHTRVLSRSLTLSHRPSDTRTAHTATEAYLAAPVCNKHTFHLVATKHTKCTLTPTHAKQVSIAREGGINPLVALVRDGTPIQKEFAAAALKNLAINAENQVAITHASWQL